MGSHLGDCQGEPSEDFPLEMKLILVLGCIILASVLVAEAKDINDEDVVVKDRTIRAIKNNGIEKNKNDNPKRKGKNTTKTKKKRKMKNAKNLKKNKKMRTGKTGKRNIKKIKGKE